MLFDPVRTLSPTVLSVLRLVFALENPLHAMDISGASSAVKAPLSPYFSPLLPLHGPSAACFLPTPKQSLPKRERCSIPRENSTPFVSPFLPDVLFPFRLSALPKIPSPPTSENRQASSIFLTLNLFFFLKIDTSSSLTRLFRYLAVQVSPSPNFQMRCNHVDFYLWSPALGLSGERVPLSVGRFWGGGCWGWGVCGCEEQLSLLVTSCEAF